MKFPAAIEKVIDGEKITKEEWDNEKIYGYLDNGFLRFHKEDKTDNPWMLSEGDLIGDDWKVI